MNRDWKAAYAALHRDGLASFPPACLHYVLELVRRESRARQGAHLAPAEIAEAFRAQVRRDFGPLTSAVLRDWNLTSTEELGRAVELLGRYDCVSLDPADTVEAFAAASPSNFVEVAA